MILKGKYKTVVAVFMLALYAFIATPVSLWHHHKLNTTIVSKEQKLQAVQQNSKNICVENCPVCSHQYAVFTNAGATPKFSPISLLQAFKPFYLLQNIESPCFDKTNKGPPQIS